MIKIAVRAENISGTGESPEEIIQIMRTEQKSVRAFKEVAVKMLILTQN